MRRTKTSLIYRRTKNTRTVQILLGHTELESTESPMVSWTYPTDCLWPFSADHAHESCWSNPMQMTGQVECKWVGKSVHLPMQGRLRAHRSKTAP